MYRTVSHSLTLWLTLHQSSGLRQKINNLWENHPINIKIIKTDYTGRCSTSQGLVIDLSLTHAHIVKTAGTRGRNIKSEGDL